MSKKEFRKMLLGRIDWNVDQMKEFSGNKRIVDAFYESAAEDMLALKDFGLIDKNMFDAINKGIAGYHVYYRYLY